MACGGGDAPVGACPGEVPELERCYAGAYFADCGGGSPPAFACDDRGQCRWFVGGCVAQGYDASECGAADLCCRDGWPYDDMDFDTERDLAIAAAVLGLGTSPWDRERAMVIPVTIEPGLEPAAPGFACSDVPDGAGETPCGESQATLALPGTLVVTLGSVGVWGWQLVLEVDLAAESRRARACTFAYADTPRACSQVEAPVCATAGTLVLNAVPMTEDELADVHGQLEAQLADGTSIAVSF